MRIEDKLSALTSIPSKYINQLKADLNLIYSDEVYQQLIEQLNPIEINTFEGKVFLDINTKDEISFKFEPSQEFIDMVLEVFKGKRSSLDKRLDGKLKVVLQNTYKGLF